MKVRAGFVSNSSGSSFLLVHMPKDFNFDVQMELLRRHAKKGKWELMDEVKSVTESDFREFVKDGYVTEDENQRLFRGLMELLSGFVILDVEVQEEAGCIQIADKKMFEQIKQIENRVTKDNDDLADFVREKESRKALLRDKMKGVDPYSEEEWDEEITESLKKIKKFTDEN